MGELAARRRNSQLLCKLTAIPPDLLKRTRLTKERDKVNFFSLELYRSRKGPP